MQIALQEVTNIYKAIGGATYGVRGLGVTVTNDKDCYCHTCGRDFHYLGIARHRAMHRDRKENCEITFTDGNTIKWNYGKKKGGRNERL